MFIVGDVTKYPKLLGLQTFMCVKNNYMSVKLKSHIVGDWGALKIKNLKKKQRPAKMFAVI